MRDKSKVSVSAFAKIVGVDEASIRLKIKNGQLSESVEKLGRGYLIDIELGKRELSENNTIDRAGNSSKLLELSDLVQDDSTGAEPENDLDSYESISVAKSQRKEAFFKAQIKEVEYNERIGLLIDKQKVYQDLFAAGRTLRDSIMSIPDRLIDSLLSCESRQQAHEILTSELHRVLVEFEKSNRYE